MRDSFSFPKRDLHRQPTLTGGVALSYLHSERSEESLCSRNQALREIHPSFHPKVARGFAGRGRRGSGSEQGGDPTTKKRNRRHSTWRLSNPRGAGGSEMTTLWSSNLLLAYCKKFGGAVARPFLPVAGIRIVSCTEFPVPSARTVLVLPSDPLETNNSGWSKGALSIRTRSSVSAFRNATTAALSSALRPRFLIRLLSTAAFSLAKSPPRL